MKKLFFLLLPLLFLIPPDETIAQNRRVERADQAFELRQYSEAIELYDKAYSRVRRKDRREAARILFQTALCYRYLNEPRRAEVYFRRALFGKYPDPIALFYYGEALMKNEEYEEAKEQFELYKEKAPDDWRAQWGIEAVKAAEYLLENPGLYEVNLEKKFNSREDDFAPAFADHRNSILIFTSSRDEAVGDNKDLWTGNNYTSLFVSFLDRQGEWSKPVVLDEGPVNTEYHEGAPSVNASGTELYFTRCKPEPDADVGCRIFVAPRAGAEWGQPTEITLVTDSTLSVGHPAISHDEMSLYFVSDMPGGIGGKDIWVAERESPGGEFKNPRNLGTTINTPGNEMFPSVREDGTLYFSSDGLPGLGGLDIFFSQPDGNDWSKPENIGTPVNSPGDDFGITFRKGANSGFFTSNRRQRGARGDVIYSFYLAPVEFTLQGTVRDDSTKVVLEGVQVQLIGSDGSFAQAETSSEGEYRFDETQFKSNTSYEILASKEGYFNQRGQETTIGIERSRDFVYDFYLAPIPDKPIELPEILYEFAQWELLPQYQDSLNGLITTLQDNPELVIELASHTDSRGTHELNDSLSQRRAQSVVDYLIQRGIDRERLVAKGYGKRVPREITKTIERDGFTFEAGTVLTEDYINTLPTEEHRDVAHQLNRRTEFRVLSEEEEDTGP
ncbi:MAG: OmpA family protein [Bacteroidota bacterium]